VSSSELAASARGTGRRKGCDVHRLVFLDETGTTTKMTRLRGGVRRARAATTTNGLLRQ